MRSTTQPRKVVWSCQEKLCVARHVSHDRGGYQGLRFWLRFRRLLVLRQQGQDELVIPIAMSNTTLDSIIIDSVCGVYSPMQDIPLTPALDLDPFY